MDWTWNAKLNHHKTDEVSIQLSNPEARQWIVQYGAIRFRNELITRVVADFVRNALCGIGVKPNLCRQHGYASCIVNPTRTDDRLVGVRTTFTVHVWFLIHRINPQNEPHGVPRP